MKLTGFLILRAVLLALYIIYWAPSLSPDEAQYWTWSQDLSWGYYSKPPGIAWQIFSTTSLFGNTEWGIRSSALIVGTLTCIAVYLLAKRVYSERVAFWSAITFALTPMSFMGSVFAITDGGMILSWLMALTYFLQSNYLAFGVWIGIGALFKWPIYILPFFLFFIAKEKWPFLKGVILSLFGFIPSLIWNVQHDFVTFKHVGTTLQGGHYGSVPNPLEFLGAQIALLSPLFFLFAVLAFIFPKGGKVLRYVTAIFVVPFIMSFFMKMQGNWSDFVLPTAHILAVNSMLESKRPYLWLSMGSLLALIFAFVIGSNLLPYPMNPLKNSLGYKNLTEVLNEIGYDPKKEYLVSDSYQVTSLLSFYSPTQDLAYFLNVSGRRLNQFSFWKSLGEDEREGGYFAAIYDTRKKPPQLEMKIAPYFSKVSYIGTFPLYVEKEQAQKAVVLYHVVGYTKEVPGNGGLF
jgi:4-amino-4-deoxy-L-arabinose transferase and related glycosyltransferases of PMT family